jgi:hypothetical protein
MTSLLDTVDAVIIAEGNRAACKATSRPVPAPIRPSRCEVYKISSFFLLPLKLAPFFLLTFSLRLRSWLSIADHSVPLTFIHEFGGKNRS